MGLDVNLYRYDKAFEVVQARVEEGEQLANTLWAEICGADASYTTVSEDVLEQYRAARSQKYSELGLGQWGESQDTTEIALPSAKYPGHMFKIGYLRSSYNSGGFNSVVHNLTDMSLYEVFNPGDEYYVRPDWFKAQSQAETLLYRLVNAQPYRATTVSFFGNPSHDAKQALEEFLKTKENQKDHVFRNFSNSTGHFYFDPLEVEAIIPGVDALNSPCVHLIYKAANEWYIQAAEIVLEMIEWVLAQPDQEKYVLHWSG